MSKSEDFLFDLTDLLSPDPASPWWVKYPERYSPKGRRPTKPLAHPHPHSRVLEIGPRTLVSFSKRTHVPYACAHLSARRCCAGSIRGNRICTCNG